VRLSILEEHGDNLCEIGLQFLHAIALAMRPAEPGNMAHKQAGFCVAFHHSGIRSHAYRPMQRFEMKDTGYLQCRVATYLPQPTSYDRAPTFALRDEQQTDARDAIAVVRTGMDFGVRTRRAVGYFHTYRARRHLARTLATDEDASLVSVPIWAPASRSSLATPA
jgi:hypothetical protein